MVALSPRFAALAALCSIVAFSAFSSPVDAAALKMRPGAASYAAMRSRAGGSDGSAPVIPLPPPTSTKRKGSKSHRKSQKESSAPERRFYGPGPFFRYDRMFFGRDESPAPSTKVVVDGKDDSVNIGDDSWSTGPDGGHVVKIIGDDKHVELPREPHHHHHHHHKGNKVIIKGDGNDVNLGSKVNAREPHHHHHHHDGWRKGNKVIVKGDGNDVNIGSKVHRRRQLVIAGESGGSYIVDAKRSSVPEDPVPSSAKFRLGRREPRVAQKAFSVPSSAKFGKRNEQPLRRDEMVGVPGHVDIMSPSSDASSPGARIASLLLAQSDPSSTDPSAAPGVANFVLNASPDDQTQVFLVPLPPTSAEMASASTAPPAERRVMLQLPVFNAATASTETWCATFDPAPAGPVALTAEPCFAPVVNGVAGPHKSQVFSLDTATNAVAPMWFGEADGGDKTFDPETPADAEAASVTSVTAPVRREDASSDSASSTGITPSSTSAMSSTSPTSESAGATSSMSPTTTSSSTAPTITGTPDSGAGDSNDMPDGSDGMPIDPATAAAESVTAQNVMLMFAPSEPEVNAMPSAAAASAQESATTTTAVSTVWETITVTPTPSATDSAESAPPTSTSASSMLPAPTSADSVSPTPTSTDSALSASDPTPSASSSSNAPTPSATMPPAALNDTALPSSQSFSQLAVEVVPVGAPGNTTAPSDPVSAGADADPDSSGSGVDGSDSGTDNSGSDSANSDTASDDSSPSDSGSSTSSSDPTSSSTPTSSSANSAPTSVASATPTADAQAVSMDPPMRRYSTMKRYSTEPYTWTFKRDAGY